MFSKKKVIVTFVAICLGAGLFLFSGDQYKQEMGTVTDTEGSTANERLLSWEAGWYMFLDNPLGVGGNNFPRQFNKYQPPEMHRDMWETSSFTLVYINSRNRSDRYHTLFFYYYF